MQIIPDAPLFRDPIFDGAADPVIIWHRQEQQWWILYTNRRASAPGAGVSYVNGTDIGVASSADGSRWLYRGTVRGLEFEPGRNTFWAPEVTFAGGQYHMFCSYVRGVPTDWNRGRDIIHYTSANLWDWQFQSVLALSSDRVIDACVYEVTPGRWKMWYKDEVNNSHTWAAESRDLFHWQVLGPEITDCAHEGPNVFELAGRQWMITDPWEGLAVYSGEDFNRWTRRDNILLAPGSRPDDSAMANHADGLVCGGRAYIFYFVHPEFPNEARGTAADTGYRQRRSSLQAAELTVDGEHLRCDRERVTLELVPPV